MKGLQILCAAALSVAAVPVMAQDLVINDFEAGAPTFVTSGFPSPTLHLTDGGGKNIAGTDTAGYIRLVDGGWGAGWTLDNAATPAAGKYRLEFYYRNGVAEAPMKAFTVGISQDGSSKAAVVVPADAQPAWTLAQSGILDLTGSPLNLVISNQQSATQNVTADLDEVRLIAITGNAPLELEVFPPQSIYLSQTETITATPRFGTETFTQVEFDVNDDGVDFTDTTAPFEFTWNTLDDVAAGTSRTLPAVDPGNTPVTVKVTVTDSDNDTASVTYNYTVDNRFTNGRQSIVVNGDFSQWQTPDGAGNTLPVGWVEFNTTETLPIYGPGVSYSPEAGDALRIGMTYAPGGEDPFHQRYALRTEGVQGNWRDLQTYFWGLGDYCRLYYLVSTDGGVSYRTTQQSAGEANSTTWKLAIQAAPKNIGLADTDFVALGTHQLNTVDNFWDDVVSEGIKMPESSTVGDWKLY